ncbi:MAG: hypothetical protein AUH79_03020 [Betaproteobacteria bacterium 13_1_40CM_4_64_4]|nr:MAG: hypothetical protein AUH79_03020 [Betaproteobacteria bacterium 13_1_40CM_4_64_4]
MPAFVASRDISAIFAYDDWKIRAGGATMIANSSISLSVDALVFDAYGTLFDVQSVATLAERLFPGHGAALSQLWRAKQLEYTWLQSLMISPTQRREDFAALTAHALDYAVEARGLPLQGAARHRLLDAYLDLSPFPDVAPALAMLGPLPRLVLSNGTREMLEPLAASTGIALHLDAIRQAFTSRAHVCTSSRPITSSCCRSGSASCHRMGGMSSAPRHSASPLSGSAAPAHRSSAMVRSPTLSSRRWRSSRRC